MRLIRPALWIVYWFVLAALLNPHPAQADPIALPVISPTHLKSQPAPAEQVLMTWLAQEAGPPLAPQTGAAPRELHPPALWRVIVYQAVTNGNWDIYRTNGWYTEATPVTTHPATDVLPQLTQDTLSVVFVSDRDGNPDIYRMGLEGSSIVRLTTAPLTDTLPVWSPDETQIAFVSLRDGNPELYVMDEDGANQQRLTEDPATDLYPSWSPDGRRLAWVRIQPDGRWLWVMELAGRQAYPLAGPLPYLQHPIWSPVGDRIAFDYDADGDDFNEVATLQLDGGGLETVVDWSPPGGVHQADLWLSDWMPRDEGEGLAFTVLEYTYLSEGTGLPPQLQFREIRLGEHRFSGEEPIVGSGLQQLFWKMFPDHELIDRWPPTSQVEPLPAYSRGIPVIKWSGHDSGPAPLTWYDVQARTELSPVWQDWLVHTILTSSVSAGYSLPIGPTTQKLFLRSRAWDEAANVAGRDYHSYVWSDASGRCALCTSAGGSGEYRFVAHAGGGGGDARADSLWCGRNVDHHRGQLHRHPHDSAGRHFVDRCTPA